MAGGGVGEAALLGAVLSSAQNKDPLQGALMGGLGGLAFGAFGGEALGEAGGLGATDFSLGQAGTQNAFANSLGSQEMIPIQDTGTGLFGNASSIAGNPALNGIPAVGANITGGIPQLGANWSGAGGEGFTGPFELSNAQTNELISRNIDPNYVNSLQDVTPRGVPLEGGAAAGQAQVDLSNRVGGSMLDTTAGAFNPPAGNINAVQDMMPAAYSGAGMTPLNTPAAASPGLGSLLSGNGKYYLAGGLGLNYLMNQDKAKYGVPAVEKYEGPLSKFKYDPMTYRPDVVTPPTPYRPVYAAGGPVEQMSNQATLGANTMYPMANMTTSAFATPYQDPRSTNMMQSMAPSGGGTVNMMSGEPNMQGTRLAVGGIASLGAYSDGGRMLKGPGDGMSDNIPARIGGKQEARLADGEFVVPADVVSHLGNGSTDAGAKQLYAMMDKVRNARTGRKQQGRQIKPQKYMPA